MRQRGFTTVVPDEFASPIVASFHNPDHPAFSFPAFEGLKKRGFIIFPGRLALADTFHIGCMGDATKADMSDAMETIPDTVNEMGVTDPGRIETTV
jgi:2-aminoethylphosphonate-pyruvate transaminase